MAAIRATCEVWIDGDRFADTGPDLTAGTPTLLDGLQITWGRETTVDQPDVSTCQFAIAARPAAPDALRVVGVGSTVDVWSTGTLAGTEAGVETFPHGTFSDLGTIPDAETAGWALGTGLASISGAAFRGAPSPGSSSRVYFALPPEQFIDYSGDPTGWDRVRRASAGQVWHVAMDVTAGSADDPATAWLGLAFVPGGRSTDVSGVGLTIGPFTLDGTTQRLAGTVTVAPGQDGMYPIAAFQVTDPTPYRVWDDAAGSWDTAAGVWDTTRTVVDNVSVMAPQDTYRRVLAWSGRVSDVTATPDPPGLYAGVTLAVTAVDRTADLANRYVGDEPWAAEPMGTRFDRVLTLADPSITESIDASVAPFVVSWRDVDNQSALALLADLATSVDAVLWSAEHAETGPYLWVEDPRNRISVQTIGLGPGGLWVIVASPRGEVTVLSSCDVLNDQVQFTSDVGDVLTRIDATWLDQTLNDDGLPEPTERTVSVVDTVAETTFGVHRAGWSTQLVTAADARTFAESILTRSRSVDYRISGLTWDTMLPLSASDDVVQAALDLVDGTRRIGLGMVITDLPGWAPAADVGVYVEGGSYTYVGGRWVLAVTVSPSAVQAKPISWDQAPAGWTWDTTDPSIDWRSLASVGPPATQVERVFDVTERRARP